MGQISIPVTTFTSSFAQPIGTPVFPMYTVNVGNPVAGSPLSTDNITGIPRSSRTLEPMDRRADQPVRRPAHFGIIAGVTNPLTTLYYDEGSTVGLSYPTSTYTTITVSRSRKARAPAGPWVAPRPRPRWPIPRVRRGTRQPCPRVLSSTRIASVASATAACIGVGYGLTGANPHGVILADSTTTPGTVTANTFPASVTSLTNVICPSSTACVAWGIGTGGPVVLAGTVLSTGDTWNAVTFNVSSACLRH